jgi:hypothetical protein
VGFDKAFQSPMTLDIIQSQIIPLLKQRQDQIDKHQQSLLLKMRAVEKINSFHGEDLEDESDSEIEYLLESCKL